MIIIGFVPFEYDKFSCSEPNIIFFVKEGGQMKGRSESNTNVWFPFMYSQK